MYESLFVPLFFVLMAMVLVWFAMVTRLYRRLEEHHSGTYEAMGRPTLFMRNSPASTLAMLKFIAVRQHRSLGDASLSKLSDFMLLFLAVYMLLFGLLFFGSFFAGAAARA